MRTKSLIIILSSLALLLFLLIMGLTKNSYDDDCMFKNFPGFKPKKERLIDLKQVVSVDSIINLESSFPYELYLSSDNWKRVSSIRADLILLDSLTKDPNGNMNVISIALTNKMTLWETNNLDSLNLLMSWAESFNTKNAFSDNYDILYESIYNFSLSKINERLDKLNQSDYSIKFNCKFQYLRMKCCQYSGACGDRDNNTTKTVRNLIENNWFYLFNRLWIGTSILFKIVSVFLILVTLYGYVCIIQKHFKNKK